MPKPIPSLKKPSTIVPVSAMEEFVAINSEAPSVASDKNPEPRAATDDKGKKRGAQKGTGRTLTPRADGSFLRKATFYLDPELDKRLSLHSVTHGVDRSVIVADLIARFLKREG